MKKILLFKSKYICYSSTWYFVDEFAKSFTKAGCDVTIAEISDFMKYSGETFDAVIDFNSILPSKKDSDGVRFPDLINAPFYNYILDHPLYHHDIISLPLKDSNLICLDNNHADYLRKYYPHLKKVIMLPLAAARQTSITPFEQRQYDLIFTGTYTSPDKVINVVREMGDDYSHKFTHYCNKLIAEPEQTLENILLASLKNSNPDEALFAAAMRSLFPVDMFVTCYFREKVIETLLSFGVNVDVWGHNWQNSPFIGNPHFVHHGELNFAHTFEVMSNSKFVLNINPWFKAGAHDRIFSAMLNGAASLTDKSSYIEDNFTNKKDIALYSLDDLGQCPDTFINLMNSPDKAAQIADEGLRIASELHTFDCRVASLLQYI